MNKTAVRIRYRIEPSDAYVRLPREVENATFRMEIDADGLLAFWLKRPVADNSAREIVREFFNSWVGQSIFQNGPSRCELFEHDLHYSNGSTSTGLLVTRLQVAGPRAEANTREQASWLFHEYEKCHRTTELIERFQRYVSRQEPLQSAAYYCWTVLKDWFNGEDGVRSSLAVSRNMLDCFSRLISMGDAQTARKAAPRMQKRAITESERFWIESTLRLLISRAGEKEHDSSCTFQVVTLSELPRLEKNAQSAAG
jgi:hypothetical protein